jgi:hypothetical protein
VSFSLLYDTLCASLPADPAALLLYSLLQCNAAAREFILVKMDVDRLIVPLLQSINASDAAAGIVHTDTAGRVAARATDPSHSSGESDCVPCAPPSTSFLRNRLYLHLILLLILSEDRGLVDNTHRRLTLSHVQWLTEGNTVRDISLASVALLVLLKLAHANCYAGRDPFVATNCAAILSNFIHNAVGSDVSSGAVGGSSGTGMVGVDGRPSARATFKLHPSVCLKLLSLLTTATRKYGKINERMHKERAEARQTQRAQRREESQTAQQQQQQQLHLNTLAEPMDPVRRINLAPPSAGLLPHSAAVPAAASSSVLAASSSATSAPAEVEDDSSFPVSASIEAVRAAFASLIRLLLELTGGCLLHPRPLASNIYLAYTLVQSARVLHTLQSFLEFDDLTRPLLALCQRANEVIHRAQFDSPSHPTVDAATFPSDGTVRATSTPATGSMSVEELMQLLKAEAHHLLPTAAADAHSSGALSSPLPRCFQYAEQARPEEFFVPLVWELAWQMHVVRGAPEHVVLFDPVELEEDEAHAAHTAEERQSVSSPPPPVASSPHASDSHDELLAAEMEAVFQEHALQQHIGDALPTPRTATRELSGTSPTEQARHEARRQAQVETVKAANAQMAAALGPLPPPIGNNARATRSQM